MKTDSVRLGLPQPTSVLPTPLLSVMSMISLVITLVITALAPSACAAPSMQAGRSSSAGYFSTLPPGSSLPTEVQCAAQVRRNPWEPRSDNNQANYTAITGYSPKATSDTATIYLPRVTGNFTGTTDEIIQWGACKWGIDEDIVRAQAAQESDWHQSMLGDCRGDALPETHGCQSMGILQVKGANIPPTLPGAWPYAYRSTAFNVDYSLAIRRACFDGKITWLNNGYRAGDIWGCVGQWFSGSWLDSGAQDYIAKVKAHLVEREL